MTDGELVRRAAAGDIAAYGELARRWYYRILAYCQARVISGHVHDAEDLAQEVFVRGFAQLNSLANPDLYGPWLRGISNHVCADRGRERHREERQCDDLESQWDASSAEPLETTIEADERDFVIRQVAAIPEELREVVLLHYYEKQTYDEMAQWLGVSRATVNERLAKARALLRIRLAKLRSDI